MMTELNFWVNYNFNHSLSAIIDSIESFKFMFTLWMKYICTNF